ncbi:MAG TPA: SCO family protein [Candidatus Hydrogenedentes bacterium]|nr:SCO family protein [Candidatus Hydrogenedentota bacterium]HRK33079.1 SCO family protein [Candidatus Hydrogenedentota bacterium]
MKSRRIGLVLILSVILVLLSLTPVLMRGRMQQSGLPVAQAEQAALPNLGPVPAFSLIDESGKDWSSDSLKGKVWVADFFLTRCQGACPVMARHMGALQDYFKNNDSVRFVSISVEPEKDTPEVLVSYAKQYEADTTRWKFLTGPISEIHRMAGTEGFKVGVPDDPMQHSRRFILVDAQGNMRGYYEGMEEMSVRECAADIERLLEEQH